MRAVGCAAAAALWACAGAVEACRYNVRDVGFVDLGYDRYAVRLEVPVDVPETQRKSLEAALRRAFRDANVDLRVHPADASRDVLPHAVLKTPAGAERAISLPPLGESGDWQSLVAALEAELVPPLADRLLGALLEAHSVVASVQGPSGEANDNARREIERAIDLAMASRPQWAKPIEADARCLEIRRDEAIEAATLLWTLGIDAEGETPQVVVLYGRGRPLGPALRVDGELSLERAVRRRLDYISQDCECDLDRSWMQGSGFPHRWEGRRERQAAEALGFDPGSPVVASEVRQIVHRTTLAGGPKRDFASEPAPLLGYQEFDLGAIAGLGEDAATDVRPSQAASDGGSPETQLPPTATSAAQRPAMSAAAAAAAGSVAVESLEEADASSEEAAASGPLAPTLRHSLIAVALLSAVGAGLLFLAAGKSN